ncbi:GumC family protein [Mucilaginibacter corticis]|nr:polysaccharide biosynthesis tyrosine autokinase [Mucilaginibacter corticis]
MKKTKKHIVVQNEPGGINLKQLYFSVYNNKYWFLLFAGIGLAGGALYTFFVPQKYNVLTSVLVKTDNSQATLTTVQVQNQDNKKNNSVQDQVGVLSSYTLNLQTLQNLGWNVSWARKNLLTTTDLFKDTPFIADTLPGTRQVKSVPLVITPVSNTQYTVKCDAVQEQYGRKHKINFEETGYFGKPFKNDYFNFTLLKAPGYVISDGDSFTLTFNDLNQLAKSYQEELKITPGDEGSDLITIELASREPERAIDYLRELVNVYIKFGLTEKNRRAANTVRFIDNQIAGISDSLQATGNTVSDFKANNNAIDINQQSTAIVNDLNKSRGDIAAAKMQLDYYSNLKRYVNSATAMKGMVAPSVVGITDASLNSLVAKLTELFHRREVLSYTATDQSPEIISLNQEISYTQKTISENLNNLISNAQLQLQSLNSQESRIISAKTVLPKTEQNLNKIKRKFDFNNDLYSYLLQKRSEAQIAEASRDPDAQVIDQASFGTATLKGFGTAVKLLIGMVLGLLLPLIYLTGRLLFKNELKYVTDIKEQLQPAIIGNILHNKFDNELPVITYPHSEITESFRSLRISIQYLLKDLPHKVISVHSSIAGEGKTFVSSNLAAILAINNTRVLLIDADLRQPRTQQIFKLQNAPGLSDYLKGTAVFNEIIKPSHIKGLHVVTSGEKPDYPSELLANHRLEGFITEAKKHFEYIIFNNSPMGIVKDGMMVVPHSDMNLFLLRMNKSSVDQLYYINELLNEGVIKNVVVALNNVTDESQGMVGQKGHGYYNDDRLLKLN